MHEMTRRRFLGTDLNQAKFSGLSHAQMVTRFFDTSQFAFNAIGTFGNSGRNILRGPGTRQAVWLRWEAANAVADCKRARNSLPVVGGATQRTIRASRCG